MHIFVPKRRKKKLKCSLKERQKIIDETQLDVSSKFNE